MITKTRVSVLAMLLILVLSGWYLFSSGLHIKTVGARHATVVVADTNGILVGSRVLVRGIEVGHVTKISQASDGAEITWDYGKSRRIPVDSKFRIDNLSALGEAFVSVLPESDSGPYLQDNARVDADRVTSVSTFKDLSEQVTKILGQVDPDQVQNVFAELDAGLPDGVEVLNDLNKVGKLLTKQFLRHEDSLRTLLSTMQPLLMKSDPVPPALRQVSPRVFDTFAMFSYLQIGVKNFHEWPEGTGKNGVVNGMSPMIAVLQQFLDEGSGDLKVVGNNLLPLASAGAASMRTVDTGKLLDQLINSANGGALTVRITEPRKTGGR